MDQEFPFDFSRINFPRIPKKTIQWVAIGIFCLVFAFSSFFTVNPEDEGMVREANQGTVVSIRGSVVDAVFPLNLPAIYNQLRAGEMVDRWRLSSGRRDPSSRVIDYCSHPAAFP